MIFKDCFNQPIVLTPIITFILFGYEFNQLIVLTKKIVRLGLGYNFNRPIVLTNRITDITFGKSFGQSFTPTSNIVILRINYDNYELIDNLTDNIKCITLGFNFNIPFNNVPTSVKKIKTEHFYYKYERLIQHKL